MVLCRLYNRVLLNVRYNTTARTHYTGNLAMNTVRTVANNGGTENTNIYANFYGHSMSVVVDTSRVNGRLNDQNVASNRRCHANVRDPDLANYHVAGVGTTRILKDHNHKRLRTTGNGNQKNKLYFQNTSISNNGRNVNRRNRLKVQLYTIRRSLKNTRQVAAVGRHS